MTTRGDKRQATRHVTRIKNKLVELYHSKKLDFFFRESGKLDVGTGLSIVIAADVLLLTFTTIAVPWVLAGHFLLTLLVAFVPFRNLVPKIDVK